MLWIRPLKLLFLLSLLLPSAVFGEQADVSKVQEATQADTRDRPPLTDDEMPDENLHSHVEEIVVRSKGSAVLYKKTVIETEVLDYEELMNTPATNVADAIRNLPGIRVQQRVQGQQAAVSIEGLPASYTMILLDGQRYAGEIGGVNDLRQFPLANVQRIEVARAAQGLRYGPEGGGGVINIITNPPPSDGAAVSLEAGAGDDQNIQGYGTAAYGNENLGGSLTFDYDRIGGFDAPENLQQGLLIPFGELRTSYDLYGKVNWNPSDTLQLRTRLGWYKRDEEFGLSETEENDERNYQRWLLSQQVEYSFQPETTFETAFTYFHGASETTIGRSYELKDHEARLEFIGEHFAEIGPVATQWTLGVDLRSTGLSLATEDLPDSDDKPYLRVASVDESAQSAGVYLILDFEPFDGFEVNAGLRGQFTNQYSPNVMGHLALLWTAFSWDSERAIRIRASYGRNSRTPSLRELYQPPSPNLGGAYFLAGNPDLEVESANTYRFGIETNPFSWVSLSAVGFYNQIQDHIRSGIAGAILTGTRLDPPDPAQAFLCEPPFNQPQYCEPTTVDFFSNIYKKQNLDAVTTRGLEARLRLSDGEWVDFQAGYTFLDTQVDDSNILADELPNEARHIVDARMTFNMPITQTSLTGRFRWRGPSLIETSGTGLLSFVSPEYSQSSWDVDLRAVQQIGENTEIFADLYNVTDNRIVDSYVVRGRSFFIGIRINLY